MVAGGVFGPHGVRRLISVREARVGVCPVRAGDGCGTESGGSVVDSDDLTGIERARDGARERQAGVIGGGAAGQVALRGAHIVGDRTDGGSRSWCGGVDECYKRC